MLTENGETLKLYKRGLERLLESHEADHGEHTVEEFAALQVEFPPWYFSTHGLSRPATPTEVDIPR